MVSERSNKAVTAPKGRPTPSRTAPRRRRRTFGSTFQWAALIAAGVVLFVIVLILIDGGDFNPFNDDSARAQPVLVAGAEVGADPGVDAGADVPG